MKSLVKRMLPASFLRRYRRFQTVRIHKKHLEMEQEVNREKDIETVFTEIYAQNKWGGIKGTFHSGSGTGEEQIVSAYISKISDLSCKEQFENMTFVDIGCGDFVVGSQLLSLCAQYIGVDIVKELIDKNTKMFGSPTTQFRQLNAVDDVLPDGDVCFIRQVFQHLSNQQIISILNKLGKYNWVFITEHYPKDSNLTQPNVDKIHGADIRLYENSGVYLSYAPFNLPPSSLTQVLEVVGSGSGENYDQGVIRTYLYKPTR